MSARFGLGVHQVPINPDVEDTFRPCGERKGSHDVLIPGENVVGRAHGAVQIVSRDAIGDFDVMHGLRKVADALRVFGAGGSHAHGNYE